MHLKSPPKAMVPPAENLQPSVVVSNSAGAEPVNTKRCSKCKEEKDISLFTLRGRGKDRRSHCKYCASEYRKEYHKKNKKKENEYSVEYCTKNRKWISDKQKESVAKKEYSKKYNAKNKDKNAAKTRLWRKINKDRINREAREIRRSNPKIRMIQVLRSRVRHALGRNRRSAKTIELVGCPIEFLISYIESKFTPKMTWENHGVYWHIDHRRPISSFDLSDPEQQKKCFHWSNLQPLEAKENMSKGAKIHPRYNNV